MVRGRREQRSVRRAPVLRVAFAWLQSEAIDPLLRFMARQ
jgi:hypothetical protein